MDIVSSTGGKILLDGRCRGFIVLDKATKKRHQDLGFMTLLEDTLSISEVEWSDYDIVYPQRGISRQA